MLLGSMQTLELYECMMFSSLFQIFTSSSEYVQPFNLSLAPITRSKLALNN